MNLTALMLAGLTVGLAEPAPSAEYLPTKLRSLKLDIDYKPDQRKSIQQVQLCVSRDQGQTWEIADAVTADKDHFVFNAKDDGLYWLNMVIVFRDGKKDPADVTKVPPAMKLLVDATAPVVRIVNASRQADEVSLEWAVEDKYPNESATQVLYKPTGPGAVGDWTPLPAGSVNKRTAKFKPGIAGPIAIQVVCADLAGNTGLSTKDIASGVTVGYTPPTKSPLDPPVLPGAEPPSITPPGGIIVPGNVPPPMLPTEPAPMVPSSPAPAPVPPNVPSTPAPPTTPFPPVTTDTTPQPIAVGTGTGPATTPAAAPPVDSIPVQVIRTMRFDLQYQIDNGPSGISRLDLYVTRDDGRTWTRWSQHDGRESPLKVVLDTRFNTQPEGDYGFRLVPVSGAGLSDGAPTSGSAPEMRVHVDVTPPMIKVFQPTADPALRNSLKLLWEATDRNFGKDPIAIEWSETPNGPWKSVTAVDAVIPVAGGPQISNRLPNTGSYDWTLPATLNTHKVYLRFTAWDAAGNKSEVTTPNPVLVDLTKPRAKIVGVIPGPGR